MVLVNSIGGARVTYQTQKNCARGKNHTINLAPTLSQTVIVAVLSGLKSQDPFSTLPKLCFKLILKSELKS